MVNWKIKITPVYSDELIVSLDSSVYDYSYVLLFHISEIESKLFRTSTISLCFCALIPITAASI